MREKYRLFRPSNGSIDWSCWPINCRICLRKPLSLHLRKARQPWSSSKNVLCRSGINRVRKFRSTLSLRQGLGKLKKCRFPPNRWAFFRALPCRLFGQFDTNLSAPHQSIIRLLNSLKSHQCSDRQFRFAFRRQKTFRRENDSNRSPCQSTNRHFYSTKAVAPYHFPSRQRQYN